MSTPKLKKNPPLVSAVRRQSILLTEDDKLRAFANSPEEQYTPKSVNKQTSGTSSSLKDVCENAVKSKSEFLTFFHDHFFGGGERELHLTHPEFIDCTKKVSEYAATYGLGIGASVTNPLDLGRNFKDVKGVGGQHRFFAEGIREEDGSFKFNGVLSERWANNKGYIYPEFNHARLFAYTEEDNGSAYLVIKPESIREIPEDDYTCTISKEPYELSRYFGDKHVIVEGKTSLPGNRIFAIFYVDTPEMDYFHPEVREYIHDVIDMYRHEGVEFMELYSDEMHIQFDWSFGHFGPYEIPSRYMTENFQSRLAKIDPIFSDFDIALIYFGYDMLADRTHLGRSHTQHVIGRSSADLYRTFRMRRTYFEMLQDQVVGMCCEARDYIRDTYVKNAGWDPLCLGHATWQESPTCDQYGPGHLGRYHRATQNGICTYDYTPTYVYSSTIREAISGCYDYFKWNDYFSYGGTDFCECGWFDRNYYGGAMSASLGTLNRNQVASWGAWGFPTEARKRFNNVSASFTGVGRNPRESIVSWGRPRAIDVLYVYPKDLTSVEERFGSWMVQYGYTNYCPADRIVNLGQVERGKLKLGIGVYSTIVVGFEPFYNDELIALLEKFVRGGGNLLWNATPPANEVGKIPSRWLRLFGLRSAQTVVEGGAAHQVNFTGVLSGIAPMKVLTDMLPDRIYNVIPSANSEAVANANNSVIGVTRKYGLGRATYIGCRLRDDQTGETGDAPSTLFDVLKTFGAYGGIEAVDNPETVSRKSEYFATRFPNGAYSLCRHYRTMKELWPEGSFRRNEESDKEFLETYELMVGLELDFEDFSLDGHKITYKGNNLLQYRLSARGKLIGFKGDNTCGVTVDGKKYNITKKPANTIFSQIEDCRIPDGYKMGWIVSSNAPEVNICTKIPENAEIYQDVDSDGLDLRVNEKLSFKGSRIIKGDIPTVVVLVK